MGTRAGDGAAHQELVGEPVPELVPERVEELGVELVAELVAELGPQLVAELGVELARELAAELAPEPIAELASDPELQLARRSSGGVAAQGGVHPHDHARWLQVRGRIRRGDRGRRGRPVDACGGQAGPQPPVPLSVDQLKVLRLKRAGVGRQVAAGVTPAGHVCAAGW
jgi:hypothetical protein